MTPIKKQVTKLEKERMLKAYKPLVNHLKALLIQNQEQSMNRTDEEMAAMEYLQELGEIKIKTVDYL